MKSPLPANLSSSISSIQWQLIPNAVPMYYESLSNLQQLRRNSEKNSLKSILNNLDETIDALVLGGYQDDQTSTRHYIMTSIALLCLGNNRLDEAHDLITPLSWNEETHFGGQSLCSQAKEDVVCLASYVHSLVHRKEGFAHGEFGMIGYQNANYWSSAAKSRDNGILLPYEKVRRQVLDIANEIGGDALNWCQKNINDSHWEPRALHELCAYTSRDEQSDDKLRDFAAKAAETELRILLEYSLNKAGYDCECIESNNTESSSSLHIDESIALAIANKISSAHLGAFQTGVVTIRNLFRPNVSDNHVFSVAAGLACRLLGSEACIYRESLDQETKDYVHIVLPKDDTELNSEASLSNTEFYGGGPLAIGDAMVIKTSSENMRTLQENVKRGHYSFIPCSKSDKRATFIDKFHGSRGERPTSVIQWSKGTFQLLSCNSIQIMLYYLYSYMRT